MCLKKILQVIGSQSLMPETAHPKPPRRSPQETAMCWLIWPQGIPPNFTCQKYREGNTFCQNSSRRCGWFFSKQIGLKSVDCCDVFPGKFHSIHTKQWVAEISQFKIWSCVFFYIFYRGISGKLQNRTTFSMPAWQTRMARISWMIQFRHLDGRLRRLNFGVVISRRSLPQTKSRFRVQSSSNINSSYYSYYSFLLVSWVTCNLKRKVKQF